MATNGTVTPARDTFCGPEGFAWYFVKDGKFLSDCVREVFFTCLIHGIFLVLGWFRMVGLWDKPKVKGGLIGYFKHPNNTLIVKCMTIVKLVCILCCMTLVDVRVILSLILDASNSIPAVFFLSDSIKFASWCLSLLLFYMEVSRNRSHWPLMRIFWIMSFVVSCVKQTQVIRDLASDPFDVLDYVGILFQIAFVANLILAFSAIFGICFARYLEVYHDPELNQLVLRARRMKIRIKLRDIWTMFSYGWYLMVPGLVCAAVQGYSVIEIADKAADTISAVKKGREAINEVMKFFLIWVPVGAVATVGQMICLGVAGEIILGRVRNNLFKALTQQDMGFFGEIGTGYLISRLTTDTDIMGMALTVQLSQLMPPLVEMISGIIKLYQASWRLSLFMNGMLLVTFILTTVRSRLITQRYAARYSDTKATSTKKATECIFGFQIVRTFGKEDAEQANYAKLVSATTRVGMTREFLEGCFEGLEQFLNSSIIALGLYYGSTLVLSGVTDVEELNSFTLVGVATIRAFFQVVRIAPEFYRASGSAARVLDLVHRKPRYDLDKGSELADELFKGHVEFRNVTFAYEQANEDGEITKQPVLTNFSLDIPAGTTVALVGASGSGKSTILSLTLRFYDVDSGEVLIDGINLKDIKPRWMLNQIGVVSQMPTLFDGTIESNVKYSCMTPEDYGNEEEFWNAIDLANAKAVLESHQEKEQFIVGEQGENLSGGQRQRISIARCIRKNPKMLIFDEVTSALDPESEAHVMVGLKNLMKGRTSLIVAHRLHTVIDVDNIVVMQKGKIIEQGKHEDLMAKKSSYYDLFSKQQVLSQMQTNLGKNVESIPTEELKQTTESLVTTLQSHECFQNEQVQQLVNRIARQLGLDKKEHNLNSISQNDPVMEYMFGEKPENVMVQPLQHEQDQEMGYTKVVTNGATIADLGQPLLTSEITSNVTQQPKFPNA